jgi:hypothetical protein
MAQILTIQPFPFTRFDAEAGGYVPCGFTTGRYVQGTATEMMNLYWKCKTFNVGGSYTNYAFNDPANPPYSTGWSGTITSNATSEIDLVCGAGLTSPFLSTFGLINSAMYVDFEFLGSDFYFNSDPNQTVKLYGNFDFETDQDDTGGINTVVGGSLAPFLINGFQVYEGESAVNFNAVGLIEDFSATFEAGDLWPYEE